MPEIPLAGVTLASAPRALRQIPAPLPRSRGALRTRPIPDPRYDPFRRRRGRYLAERCEPNLGLALGQLAVRMLGNSQIPPRTNVILICLFRTRKKPIFCWMKSLN